MTNPVTPNPDKLSNEDLADIQGLIVNGYNFLFTRYFVLTIGDAQAACNFFGKLVSDEPDDSLRITSAKRWAKGETNKTIKPPYALNLGITAQGLSALKVPDTVQFNVGNFESFLKGAVAASESVFDVGTSSPDNWVTKLKTSNADYAHVLLSLYAHTKASVDEYSDKLRKMYADVIPPEGNPHHEVLEWDSGYMPNDHKEYDGKYRKIHFGYVDGISNPIIDSEGAPPLRENQLPYVQAWQFVLRDGAQTTYNFPQPGEFALNGSFSAFRILDQNVPAFDAFLKADGRTEEEQEFLASKLCGRWRNGNPVVVRPDKPGKILPPDQLQDFFYNAIDKVDNIGEPCPYSAHTRRTNPRGMGVTGANARDNRIMRRADAYGDAPVSEKNTIGQGLVGHFICASLKNQFEFIMKLWVNGSSFPNFSGREAGIDPLLGNFPEENNSFTYWKDEQPVTVKGLSQFVTTRGGMYCFLPSLTSVKWMAVNGNSDTPWVNPCTSSAE